MEIPSGGDVKRVARKSLKGLLILMIGRGCTILIQFFGVVFIARQLGSYSFGEVSLAYIPTSMAIIIMDLGINSAIIRFVSYYKFENKSRYIKTFIETGFAINLVIGVLCTFLINRFAPFIAINYYKNEGLIYLIRLYSVILISHVLLNTSQSVLIGYERMMAKSKIDVILSISRSLIGPLFVYFGWGPSGSILGNIISQYLAALSGCFLVIVIWMSEDGEDNITHYECMKIIYKYSFPLFLSNLVTGLNLNINNLLLSVNVSPLMMGNFQAATRSGVLVTFFSAPLSTILFPLFSKLNDKPDFIYAIYKKSVKYIGILLYPIIFAFFILANPLSHFLFGSDYVFTASYMQVYILSFFLIGLGSLSTSHLLLVVNTNIVFYQAVIRLIITVLLGLFIIPLYGVYGSIIAGFVGSFIGYIYGLLWLRKNLGLMPDFLNAIKIIISSVISTLFIYVFFDFDSLFQTIIGGIMSIISYSYFIIKLKIINNEDLDMLESIFDNGRELYYPIFILFSFLRKIVGTG